MKAAVLVKNGSADSAFEMRDVETPQPKAGEVLIKNEGFGLNFADVMARKGLYKDCPPLPTIVGYDVAGTVEKVGEGVTSVKVGERVLAMTRFGGYAEYSITREAGIAVIPDEVNVAEATALATQYCTAYYASVEMVNLFPGDIVLIHSAAGGVGTALIQIAKSKGCTVVGSVGTDEKVEFIKSLGADHAINYNKTDCKTACLKYLGKNRFDATFNALGGKTVKDDMSLIGAGGRVVLYGAALLSGKGPLGRLKSILQFGFYHPAPLMMKTKSIIGVNMLQLSDFKPDTVKRCLEGVVELYKEGKIKPVAGQQFSIEQLSDAHAFLESRKSMGKIAVTF